MHTVINPLGAPFDFVSDADDFDHGGLLDLTADDHTQYALLAGRAGGQNLRGGTASGDDLTLESTSNATKGSVFVATGSQLELWNTDATFAASPPSLLVINNSYTFDDPTTVFQVLDFMSTLEFSDDSPIAGLNLFINRSTVKNQSGSGVIALGTQGAFVNQNTIRADGAAITSSVFNAYRMGTTFDRINAGTLTVANARGLFVNPVIDTGATVTTLVGVDINPTLTGTVTTGLSLRSVPAAFEMRHAGPAVFGANAAPTVAGVGIEINSTTRALLVSRMTGAQRNALTATNGMIIYNTVTNTFQGLANGVWVNL